MKLVSWMMRMRWRKSTRIANVLSLLFLLAITAVAAMAQQKLDGSPVRVKDDGGISGKRKVELLEQRFSPTLTMTISAEIDVRTSGERFRDLGVATIHFVSTTGKREYGGGGSEFSFLVNGRRVAGGSISSSPVTDKRNEDGKELAFGAMGNGALEEIGRGREVKMQVDGQVITLDKSVVENIARFIRELVK